MDLIFHNCELYNGTVSEVGKHGVQVKKVWMKAWMASGLDTGGAHSACSSTALIYTTKLLCTVALLRHLCYEMPTALPPQVHITLRVPVFCAAEGTSFPTTNFAAHGNKSAKRPPNVSDGQPASKAARTGGGGRAPSLGAPQMSAQMSSHGGLPSAPKSAPSAAPGGMQSHGRPAARAAPAPTPPRARGPFPEDRSASLFEYIGEIDEAAQAAVLEFLQHQCQVELPMDEDGEVELDPDALSAEVLWKLDDHMRGTSNGKYSPGNFEPPVLTMHQPGLDEETDDE